MLPCVAAVPVAWVVSCCPVAMLVFVLVSGELEAMVSSAVVLSVLVDAQAPRMRQRMVRAMKGIRFISAFFLLYASSRFFKKRSRFIAEHGI